MVSRDCVLDLRESTVKAVTPQAISMKITKTPHGFSSDAANASATTLFDCNTQVLWNDLPDLAVAFYCVAIKLPDRLFSLWG